MLVILLVNGILIIILRCHVKILTADIVIVAMGLVLLTLLGINDFNTGIYTMLICLMVWLNRLIIANGGTDEINKE